jgi:LacI family transcriptional regulator
MLFEHGTPGSAVTEDRIEGYKLALTQSGRMIDENLIATGEFSENSGYLAMQQLLPHHPDAVFAASDITASGAMRAIFDAGLRVPDDVALVGFDDLPLASTTQVKLTTVHQPITKFGVQAVELLQDVITNGCTPARHIILDTELIIRDSCGAIEIGR